MQLTPTQHPQLLHRPHTDSLETCFSDTPPVCESERWLYLQFQTHCTLYKELTRDVLVLLAGDIYVFTASYRKLWPDCSSAVQR